MFVKKDVFITSFHTDIQSCSPFLQLFLAAPAGQMIECSLLALWIDYFSEQEP